MAPMSGRKRANLDRTAKARSSAFATPRRRWYRRGWRGWLKVGAAFLGGGAAILGAMIAYAAVRMPSVDDIGKRTGTIKIYADDNTTLVAELGHDARTVHTVPVGQIAPVLQQATVAAEDKNFYNEGAFNVPRVAKALFIDVIARHPTQGASTITQQLAKQAFFVTDTQTADKSPFRKLQEALLANELDQKYSKDQILEKYLNLIYYGENAYGIESASLRYFGKHAAQLSLQESSLLAGLPQAPSQLDPLNNARGAYARQHYVLGQMVADGYIGQAQADAVDPLVGGASPTPDQQALQKVNQAAILAGLQKGRLQSKDAAGLAPHFAQYVENQLSDPTIFGQDDPAVTSGNLSVYTTLNLADQTKAATSVQNGVKRIGGGANNGALLMLDAHTGAIKAMVGSADYNNADISGQFNVVTAERRPGSSFKPYVYEDAFRMGTIKPESILQDTAAQSAKLGGTKDFDGAFMGPMQAQRALLLSRNVPTEQAWQLTGGSNIIDFAHGLGITSDIQDNVSSAIGSSSVKMIEHAAAYAAFANGGQKVSAWGIKKVVDTDSQVVLKDLSAPAGQGSVMSGAEAYTITKILRGYAAQWHEPFNVPTAGKSGTTDDFVDAWYMVYTPDVVVGTWAGRTEASSPGELGMTSVFGTATGSSIAAPFVNALGLPRKEFPVPAGSTTPPPSPTPTDTATPEVTSIATPAEPTPTPRPTRTPAATPCPTPKKGVIATPPTPSPLFTLPPTACP
jgi:membrane peptidoglycan carboxypeptidase